MLELDLFSNSLHKGSKVLDVGCAAGRDSRQLSDRGLAVTGVDLSDRLLAIARKNSPEITCINADIRTLPFKNDSFDGLWVIAVLHHIGRHDMAPALIEFNRVLRPAGVICIRTKRGHGNLKVSESLSLDREREFTLLSSWELDQMLVDSGFEKSELY